MSFAPDSLKALRRYLVEKTGKPTENFGIRGTVGPKRNSGYHLGKSDIYGPGGLGDKDYSVRRPRDKAGLSDASAGFDIKLPVPELKKLVAYLVREAKAGRAPDLVEVIGPGPDGRAYDWRKPDWKPIGPRDKGDGHEWHNHDSFHRDSEFRDKIALFEGHFGKRTDPSPVTPPSDPVKVRLWQSRLVVHGFAVEIDGIFGPQTLAAVEAFQEASGMVVDGIVGPITEAALLDDPEPEPIEEPTPPPPTAEELLRAQVAELEEKIATAKEVLT